MTFTTSDGAAAPPDLPGEVLFRRQRARQWQIMLRTAGGDCAGRARQEPRGAECRGPRPSLEEIFVAYMQQGRDAGGGNPAPQEAKP